MADAEHSEVSAEPQARHVTYCGDVIVAVSLHTAPRGTVKKCQEWLEKNNKELYDRIWSAGQCGTFPAVTISCLTHISPAEALEAATASLSVEAQKRAAKDAQKKTAKAEAAEAKQADKMANSVVTIKRIERNKKKFVTAVIGLEAFGLELKKVAKDLGKKFATGSSVTKLPSGGEEIVVQGDVSDELEEFILEKYKEIPADNIELVDDKKKKKAAAA
ncbi:Translation initiation factor SUI1 [Metarhizium album ARSEF 1941]|uniref:Translation machinery-associated protein 22 n=1 Tax=Metarhizium album (strain ARSEF 1941) TaxID=1081103 RepID=A0A0B2WN07_METAS|nr:Translation initiation factor SUI1 [Metarhizium album ARSEF 1941]KHN95293.1 Translation initiation factor SUI1 [Metarhizium album ARSEF 1941]